jgi:hypothetical protein
MRKIILGMLFTLAVMAGSGMKAGFATAAEDYDDWKAPPPAERQIEPREPERNSEPRDHDGWSFCDRLRYRCIRKEERGEYSEGACRRYEEECGRGSHCERLRRACEYRYERGEAGEGNCRRYRQECRGGY